MDINEATQMLKVTDQEIKAVRNYLGFEHTDINILSNLDPRVYNEQKQRGWLLAENKDDLKRKIQIFVDMYSAMYKDSLGAKASRGFIRGTSGARARALYKTNTQFLSTSRDERVAKRFCEYKNPALVRISIGDGVPRLYSDGYIESTINEDEQEVIIAPFCKIKDNQLVSKFDGYEYYNVVIEKGELQEKSKDEIQSLTNQVIEDFEQNLVDMRDFTSLEDRIDYLKERLNRTLDNEERIYISQDLKKAEDEHYAVWKRTTAYKDNLNALLQGMCREKEKEIDQAKEIVDNDREEKRKEREAKKQDEAHQKVITDASQKIRGAFGNTVNISNSIISTYQQLIDKEQTYKKFAAELGIGYGDNVRIETERSVNSVNSAVNELGKKLQQVQISPDSTIEEAQAKLAQYEGQISRIGASKEIADALPEVVELFGIQAEDEIKKDLYAIVNGTIKNAKINLLQQQKLSLESKKLGIFDMITGKTKLQDLQLKNIALKMQLISESNLEHKSNYSVRDMLSEIYTFSQTELDGKYTPELEKLFNQIRSKFGIDSKGFSLEQIQKLAEPKIAEYRKKNLPAIPKKKFRLFGKNKEQIESLERENTELQTDINNLGARKLVSRIKQTTKPATTVFKERLQDIAHNFCEEGPAKTQKKTNDITNDIWK